MYVNISLNLIPLPNLSGHMNHTGWVVHQCIVVWPEGRRGKKFLKIDVGILRMIPNHIYIKIYIFIKIIYTFIKLIKFWQYCSKQILPSLILLETFRTTLNWKIWPWEYLFERVSRENELAMLSWQTAEKNFGTEFMVI